MKTHLTILGLSLGLLTVAVAPAVAHHAFGAEFDANQSFDFSGTVTKIEWLNPHVYFYIDVQDEETGDWTNWAMEMGSPNGLMRRGWSRNSLRIGDEVSVQGSKEGQRPNRCPGLRQTAVRWFFSGRNPVGKSSSQ